MDGEKRDDVESGQGRRTRSQAKAQQANRGGKEKRTLRYAKISSDARESHPGNSGTVRSVVRQHKSGSSVDDKGKQNPVEREVDNVTPKTPATSIHKVGDRSVEGRASATRHTFSSSQKKVDRKVGQTTSDSARRSSTPVRQSHKAILKPNQQTARLEQDATKRIQPPDSPTPDAQKLVGAKADANATTWTRKSHKWSNGEVPWVMYCRNREESETAALLLKDETALGFDMEWVPYYRHKDVPVSDRSKREASVIQLASEKVVAVFHLARHKEQGGDAVADTLRSILESESIIKCGVNIIAADAPRLVKHLAIVPQRLLELSRLHRCTDQSITDAERKMRRPIALAELVEQTFGLPLAKESSTREGDWSTTLTNKQLEYAANDACASIALFNAMRSKGRSPSAPVDMPLTVRFRPDRSWEEDHLGIPLLGGSVQTDTESQATNEQSAEVTTVSETESEKVTSSSGSEWRLADAETESEERLSRTPERSFSQTPKPLSPDRVQITERSKLCSEILTWDRLPPAMLKLPRLFNTPPLSSEQINSLSPQVRATINQCGYFDRQALVKRGPKDLPCLFRCGRTFTDYRECALHLVSAETNGKDSISQDSLTWMNNTHDSGVATSRGFGYCGMQNRNRDIAVCPFRHHLGTHIQCPDQSIFTLAQTIVGTGSSITKTIAEVLAVDNANHQLVLYDTTSERIYGLPCECGLRWASPYHAALHYFTDLYGPPCTNVKLSAESYIETLQPSTYGRALFSPHSAELFLPNKGHSKDVYRRECIIGDSSDAEKLIKPRFSSAVPIAGLSRLFRLTPEQGELVVFPFRHPTVQGNESAERAAESFRRYRAMLAHHHSAATQHAAPVFCVDFECDGFATPVFPGEQYWAISRYFDKHVGNGASHSTADHRSDLCQMLHRSAVVTDTIFQLFSTRKPHERVLLMVGDSWTTFVEPLVWACARHSFYLHIGLEPADLVLADRHYGKQDSGTEDENGSRRSRFCDVVTKADKRHLGFYCGRHWFNLESRLLAKVYAGLCRDELAEGYLRWCLQHNENNNALDQSWEVNNISARLDLRFLLRQKLQDTAEDLQTFFDTVEQETLVSPDLPALVQDAPLLRSSYQEHLNISKEVAVSPPLAVVQETPLLQVDYQKHSTQTTQTHEVATPSLPAVVQETPPLENHSEERSDGTKATVIPRIVVQDTPPLQINRPEYLDIGEEVPVLPLQAVTQDVLLGRDNRWRGSDTTKQIDVPSTPPLKPGSTAILPIEIDSQLTPTLPRALPDTNQKHVIDATETSASSPSASSGSSREIVPSGLSYLPVNTPCNTTIHLAPPLTPAQAQSLPESYRSLIDNDGFLNIYTVREEVPGGVACQMQCGRRFKSYAHAALHLIGGSRDDLDYAAGSLGYQMGEARGLGSFKPQGSFHPGPCYTPENTAAPIKCPYQESFGEHVQCKYDWALVRERLEKSESLADSRRELLRAFASDFTLHQGSYSNSLDIPSGLPCRCGLLWASPPFAAVHLYSSMHAASCGGRALTVEEFIGKVNLSKEILPCKNEVGLDEQALVSACLQPGQCITVDTPRDDDRIPFHSFRRIVPAAGGLIVFPLCRKAYKSEQWEAEDDIMWQQLAAEYRQAALTSAAIVKLRFICEDSLHPLTAGDREWALVHGWQVRDSESISNQSRTEQVKEDLLRTEVAMVDRSALFTDTIFRLLESRPSHNRVILAIDRFWTVCVPLLAYICAVYDFRLHIGLRQKEIEIADQYCVNGQGSLMSALQASEGKRYIGKSHNRHWFEIESRTLAATYAGIEHDSISEGYIRWCSHYETYGGMGKGGTSSVKIRMQAALVGMKERVKSVLSCS